MTTICIGCGAEIPKFGAYRIKVEVGRVPLLLDGRPKSPAGARIGEKRWKRIMRPDIKTGDGCVSCSLKYPCVEQPRDYRRDSSKKTWRVR